MKILHIYRGYGAGLINPVIDNQIATLSVFDDTVYKFILNKGGARYFTNIFKLGRFIRKNKIDIIHAHYSFSGFMAGLAFSGKPIVCSLMGSDVHQDKLLHVIIKIFINYFWKYTIVKSKEMQNVFPKTMVIPNGVDTNNFYPRDMWESYTKTGFNTANKNIIFIAVNPNAEVKNLALAQNAVKQMKDSKVILHQLSTITFEDLPYYYSCADLLLLTSLSEGSPNVVKEAMACNCPIVATKVGDIYEIIYKVNQCYTTTFEVEDVAEKIKLALDNGQRSNGFSHISALDSNVIAEKLKNLYCKANKK